MSIESRFQKAIQLRNAEEYNSSVHELEEILYFYPDHPKLGGILVVLAGVCQSLGDNKSALKYFQKASDLKPESEIASLGLYLTYIELGQSKEAILELKRYLSENEPNNYKTTIRELLEDLEMGYVGDFKEDILYLAKKHNIGLGIG